MLDLQEEIREIDKESVIVLLSSLFLMCFFPYQGTPEYFLKNFYVLDEEFYYLGEVYRFFFTFLFFFIIPSFIVIIILKKSLKSYGLKIGDYRFGLKVFVLSIIILPIPIYLNSKNPDFLNEYPLWKNFGDSGINILKWSFLYLFYYIGWEFFFRGYLQFSLINKIPAFFIIMIQTIPSTIIHIGKPQGETISAIFAGIIFWIFSIEN
ncbi:MAG: hypothetical protein KatS3mg068_2124 [Candidatus Sericytochromatia bacterium]|nr:MAG: hypothetical protein KatS3mg068_2124 [Candidatus Sericytochromatia bacterium]